MFVAAASGSNQTQLLKRIVFSLNKTIALSCFCRPTFAPCRGLQPDNDRVSRRKQIIVRVKHVICEGVAGGVALSSGACLIASVSGTFAASDMCWQRMRTSNLRNIRPVKVLYFLHVVRCAALSFKRLLPSDAGEGWSMTD